MPTPTRKLFVILDDHDRHDQRCRCGKCDSNGRSYGAGIFDVQVPDDCVERLYAPSEAAATALAEAAAKELGELVDYPEEVDEAVPFAP